MKTKIATLLFAVSLLIVVSCEKGRPEMKFDQNEHDFGTIVQGDKVVHDFKFTNTGGSDLKITNAMGSCGCTIPEYPTGPIKPGASGNIKVSFNSAGKSGETEKTVTIFCNTKNGTETLKIKANIEVPQKGQTN